MKTAKLTGQILKGTLIVSSDKEVAMFTAEFIESNGKRTESVYKVRCDTPTEGYRVEKMEGNVYNVNMWDKTCSCDGAKAGFLCRHIRMVSALTAAKKIK